MAMTRPQPLADHTNIIKRTGENFPKTALASIQLMCLIAKTNQVIRFYVFLRETENFKFKYYVTINIDFTFFIYCS